MHATKTVTALLSAAAGSAAFKIRAFSGSDCTGSAEEVNVWDNTCRSEWIPPTKSFRVLNYGAGRQVATFWENNYCSNSPPPQQILVRRADGSSDAGFKVGNCLNLDKEPGAFGSHSG